MPGYFCNNLRILAPTCCLVRMQQRRDQLCRHDLFLESIWLLEKGKPPRLFSKHCFRLPTCFAQKTMFRQALLNSSGFRPGEHILHEASLFHRCRVGQKRFLGGMSCWWKWRTFFSLLIYVQLCLRTTLKTVLVLIWNQFRPTPSPLSASP